MKNIYLRRIERFFNILNTSKNIIFIYSTELCIYNKNIRNKQDENYEYLLKIENFLLNHYINLNFKIINFSMNQEYVNTKNIYNININIDHSKLSDNMETHINEVWCEYRYLIQNEIFNIFNL